MIENEMEIKALKFKIKNYEKALAFYANRKHYEAWAEYEDATGFFNDVDFDNGEKARNVLDEFMK